MNRRLEFLLAVGVTVVSLSACSFGKTINTSSIFAMNTIMEIQVAGDEELLTEAEGIIRNLEKELSVTDEGSEISKLNESGKAGLTGDVADIMKRALDVCAETDGALDITIYPVLKAWGFTTESYRVPGDGELQELLDGVDYRKVVLSYEQGENSSGPGITDDGTGTYGSQDPEDGHDPEDGRYTGGAEELQDVDIGAQAAQYENSPDDGTGNIIGSELSGCTAVLPKGVQVDLGSVVKGYTGTAIADMFREHGVESALINLGGNVQCVGRKPDGTKWKIAVKSPFGDSATKALGVIEAEDTAIITSGGYERFFEQDGEIYWHILDPKTGSPAKSGLASVTVIGKDGLRCDGLSTALFVMGLDGAISFWKGSGDFGAVFVTEDRQVYITENVAADFSLTSEYRNLQVNVVSR